MKNFKKFFTLRIVVLNKRYVDNRRHRKYACNVIFEFSDEKNQKLKHIRDISFETVIVYVLEDKILDIIEHPKRENQYMYVLRYNEKVYVCPFVVEPEKIFLKTIFPSRKIAREYGEGKNE